MPTEDGRVIIRIETNSQEAARELEKLTNASEKLKNTSKEVVVSNNKVTSVLHKLAPAIKGAVAAYGALKLKDLAVDAIKTAAAFEQLSVSFRVMTGSASVGQKLTNELIQLAKVTPMTTEGLARNTQTLLGFGESAENVIEDLKILGDISGGNQQRMDLLTLAFAQAGATGRLLGQDVRQMINQGFNPLQVISEKTGKSMSQLQDEMSKGQISFSMLKEAMKDATSEGGRFYGLMNQQSQTLEGRLSTLHDTFTLISNDIGQILLPVAKNAVEWFSNWASAVQELTTRIRIARAEIASLGLDDLRQKLRQNWVEQDKVTQLWGAWNNLLGSNVAHKLAGEKLISLEKEEKSIQNQINLLVKEQKETETLNKLKNAGFKDSTGETNSKGKKAKTPDNALELASKELKKYEDLLYNVASAKGIESEAFKKAQAGYFAAAQGVSELKYAVESVISPYQALNTKLQEQQTLLSNAIVIGDELGIRRAENAIRELNTKFNQINKELEQSSLRTRVYTNDLNGLNAKLADEGQKLDNLIYKYIVLGQGTKDAIYTQKNIVKELENQSKSINNLRESFEGLNFANIRESISNDLAAAITTPLKEGENALERFGNLAINIFQMIAQEATRAFIVKPIIENISNAFKKFKGDMIGGASPITQLSNDAVKGATAISSMGAAMGVTAPIMKAASPAMTAAGAAMASAAIPASTLGAALTQAAIAQAALSVAGIPIAGAVLAPIAATATGAAIGLGNTLAAAGMSLSKIAGKFAKGGVVSSPTYFPMSGGTGLMGEAGPESIMPLKRMPNGDLGVQAQVTQPNITIYNYSNTQIETIRRPNGDVDMKIQEMDAYLSNERSNGAFQNAANRNSKSGVTAA